MHPRRHWRIRHRPRRGGSAPLEASHELGDREHVARDGSLEPVPVAAVRDVELRIEGVQAKAVTVGSGPRRRAGPPVADRAEVAAALPRRALPLGEAAASGVDAPGEPVRERAARGIGMVEDEGQRAGVRR